MPATPDEILKIHRQVTRLRKYSDRLIGIGPFGIGLDGVLAWVPGVNTVFSGGAAAWLLVQAARSGARPATLFRMLAYLGVDTASSGLPFFGWAVDTVFPGHLMAANSLLKDIEERHPHTRPIKTIKPVRPPRFKPAR